MADASHLSAANPPAPEGDCRVAVFAAPSDLDELSELFERQLRLHPTDARIHAHAVPGLLPDRLSREEAETLASAIASLGLASHVFHQRKIPDVDDASVVHHARCTDAGLEIFDVEGNPDRVVEWDAVELLSIGNVPNEPQRIYQAPEVRSMVTAPTPPKSTRIIPTTTGPHAYLSADGGRQVWCIEHERMNYESLGDRKTLSASKNFRTFITDLAARIPQAYLTPATRAYLDHGLVRHFLFDSRDEFQRYTQFHILLRHRLREGG